MSSLLNQILREIKNAPWYENQIAHVEKLHAKKPEYAKSIADLDLEPEIIKYLESNKISLYRHQYEALKEALQQKNVIVTTPTSSGKTLIYQIAIFNRYLKERHKTFLIVSPRKALTQDQVQKFNTMAQDLGLSPNIIGAYDGDTSRDAKAYLRKYGRILFTNPYGLHFYLAKPSLWRSFFSQLTYIVVDESHIYKGIFGSNVAFVFRRFKRILEKFNANPAFILSSATIGNPLEAAEKLTGETYQLVSSSTAGQVAKTLVMWNPPFYSHEQRYAGLSSQGYLILRTLVENDVQTLMFMRARIQVELMARRVKEYFANKGSAWEQTIMPYRGGYLPQDRRNIERQIRNRDLLGIVSTNALELGIDIGTLDATVLGGYPGSINSFWQQTGRSGRTRIVDGEIIGKEALSFYMPKNDPLDLYFLHNPEELIEKPPEDSIIDLSNRYIIKNQLWCAAYEQALSANDFSRFGEKTKDFLAEMVREGKLRQIGNRYMPANRKKFPPSEVALDSIAETSYKLLLVSNGIEILLTSEDQHRVISEFYPRAVYLYMAETYIVQSIDHQAKEIRLIKNDVDYYTDILINRDVAVLGIEKEKEEKGINVFVGGVNVTSLAHTMLFKNYDTGEIRDAEIIHDSPVFELNTKAVWWNLPENWSEYFIDEENMNKLETLLKDNTKENKEEIEEILEENRKILQDKNQKRGLMHDEGDEENMLFGGALHAVEHACIAMVPYFSLCDRNDIGGLSTPRHLDTNASSIFIYDGFSGGIGISEKIYSILQTLWEKTLDMIETCPCDGGCPGCIMSPKCGNQNNPLNKTGAKLLLKLQLGALHSI